MNFQQLLEWQWSDYAGKHRNRTNLLIHIVAVPMLWFGAIQVLGALLLMLGLASRLTQRLRPGRTCRRS